MDTTPCYYDELRQLFSQLPVEKPSEGFSKRVMAHITFEVQCAAHRKRICVIAWAVSIPCSIALLLIAGFFTRQYWEIYLWKYFEPVFTSISHTTFSIAELFVGNGYRFISLGMLFLGLLLCDLFFRRYMERKSQMTSIT